jgi:hypothetical protein
VLGVAVGAVGVIGGVVTAMTDVDLLWIEAGNRGGRPPSPEEYFLNIQPLLALFLSTREDLNGICVSGDRVKLSSRFSQQSQLQARHLISFGRRASRGSMVWFWKILSFSAVNRRSGGGDLQISE